MAQSTDIGPYLVAGPLHQPSDARVRSGYPIWTLVSVWDARGQSDEAVIREYALDPAEWAAAKAYYLAHSDVIDARRTLNDEPGDMPPEGILLEDLLARHSCTTRQDPGLMLRPDLQMTAHARLGQVAQTSMPL